MEVWEEGDYIPIATLVTTRMIPALRWAAMRAILMFQQEVMDKVTGQCPQTTTLKDVDVKITSGYINSPLPSMVSREPLWPSVKALGR